MPNLDNNTNLKKHIVSPLKQNVLIFFKILSGMEFNPDIEFLYGKNKVGQYLAHNDHEGCHQGF